eukprot:967250-Prymnesium_polylepis.1
MWRAARGARRAARCGARWCAARTSDERVASRAPRAASQVLANVHVFDVAYEGADNTGRPRAHLSMLFDYSKGPQGAWQLAKVTGEPLWLEATG